MTCSCCSRFERLRRICAPDRLLAGVPSCDSLSFLGCERGKNEMWISGFPCQGFGFIEREAKHLFGCFEGLAELGEDGVFGVLNLSDELSAGEQANVGD